MSLLPTVLAALVGAAVFERLGVPAGALLGAVVGVAALNLVGSLPTAAELPAAGRFLAYAGVGWLIGQGVTSETVRTLGRSLLPITLVVGALLAFGVGLGWLLVQLGVMDPATAYLAASPGALSQMAAVSASVGADAGLVVAVHTLRVVLLLVAAPFIGRLAGAG